MEILADIQRWFKAQCDDEWEHEFGIRITTMDNPGWQVKIDLAYTRLEDQPFEPVKMEDGHGVWLSCHVEDGLFQGMGDTSQLSRILEIFIAWAKSVPDWLAPPEPEDEATLQAAEDKRFIDFLGEENGPEMCRVEGCAHKRISHSVLCRRHHFEAIRERPFPSDTA